MKRSQLSRPKIRQIKNANWTRETSKTQTRQIRNFNKKCYKTKLAGDKINIKTQNKENIQCYWKEDCIKTQNERNTFIKILTGHEKLPRTK